MHEINIIRYPEGHPVRAEAEAEYQARQDRLARLARDPRIAEAIRFIREQGEARRPDGAIWPAAVDEAEALKVVGLEVTEDGIAILRDWVFRARPVTIY